MSLSGIAAAPVDAEAIRRARERADAAGIIEEVNAYCATRCPIRLHCPGMECRQYRREHEARDVLLRLEDAPDIEAEVGPAGILMAPVR